MREPSPTTTTPGYAELNAEFTSPVDEYAHSTALLLSA